MVADNNQQNEKNAEVWAALRAHVSRGEEAIRLLEEVYWIVRRVPRYIDGKLLAELDGKLLAELDRFFDFDDSE